MRSPTRGIAWGHTKRCRREIAGIHTTGHLRAVHQLKNTERTNMSRSEEKSANEALKVGTEYRTRCPEEDGGQEVVYRCTHAYDCGGQHWLFTLEDVSQARPVTSGE